ncbi:hypothetical protein SUDANB95_00165 [Actinosynnema sp. ALI-1.44]
MIWKEWTLAVIGGFLANWLQGGWLLLTILKTFLVPTLVVVAGVVLGRMSTRIYRKKEFYCAPPRSVEDKNRAAADKASRAASLLYRSGLLDSPSAIATAGALTRVREFNQRLSETYDLAPGSVFRSTVIEGRIPPSVWEIFDDEVSQGDGEGGCGSEPAWFYFPLVDFRKGNLLDHLSASRPDGSGLRILGSDEGLVVLATALRWQLLGAAERGVADGLPAGWDTVESDALALIAHEDPSSADIDEVAMKIRGLGGPAERLEAAVELVRTYARKHVLIAPVEVDVRGGYRVSFTQTLAPREEGGVSRADRIAISLGASAVSLVVVAGAAYSAQSYHANIVGPEGLYLARQWPHNPHLPDWSNFEFQSANGRVNGHFYASGLPERVPGDPLSAKFEYYETPPGSALRAGVTALAAFVLFVVLGLVSSGKDATISTDAAAFLLVFPAVAAAWLGFDGPHGRLVGGTVAARLSLIATTVLSVTAAALFIFRKEYPTEPTGRRESRDWYDWPQGASDFTPFAIADWGWSVLALLALLNVVIIFYVATCRARHYLAVVSGKPSDQ